MARSILSAQSITEIRGVLDGLHAAVRLLFGELCEADPARAARIAGAIDVLIPHPELCGPDAPDLQVRIAQNLLLGIRRQAAEAAAKGDGPLSTAPTPPDRLN